MIYFEYDKTSPQAEYYEILQGLMERWEYEIVEFKEAKGGYNEDKIGQYFSAISNEANLKGQQYGWFVLGVSESGQKRPVGTAFKQGKPDLIEKFKYSISKDLTDGITFLDVVELFPIVDGVPKRVLMFKIPASAVGIPTEWKTKYYARSGDSLVDLPQAKLDIIRSQQRKDWSRILIQDSSIQDLDVDAIAYARQKYKEKMNKSHIAEEIDALSDEEFLTKLKLMKDGHVTNAAMVLLGSEEHDDMFESAPSIMWRLYGSSDEMKDYEIFKVPFITVVDKVFTKIRNLTYRYMPNQLSLFPKETQQYDLWLLRELLNNCIAHSNYQLGGRIYVNEEEDSIGITNPGDFLPKSVENVLKKTYNPPFYRNQLLADAMVKFDMIDTATSGIKKVYRIQRNKYFPMPDYDFSRKSEVAVVVYGKVLDDKYTQLLFANNDELDIETVFLLDQVQKNRVIAKEYADGLRKKGLIEGRYPHIYVSCRVADMVGQKTDYIHNRGLEEDVCKQLIIQALKAGPCTQKELLGVLDRGALPAYMDEKQKSKRVSYLLQKMKGESTVYNVGSRNHSKWYLSK
jgi:ATP-dependent DNA helicase RecG